MGKLKLFVLFLLFCVLAFLSWRIFYEFPDEWSISSEKKLPIVYSDNYDITLFGLQKLHSFDSQKYSKRIILYRRLMRR